MLMGQITRPNLITVLNLHYGGENSGQTLRASFPHTRRLPGVPDSPLSELAWGSPATSSKLFSISDIICSS